MGRTLLDYLKLFRFPFVFTAIADSVTGYFLTLRDEPRPLTVGMLALSSSCLYFLGMALNDVGDRERDRVIHPDRVIPSGRVSVRGALIACGVLLVVSVGALVVIPAPGFQRFWFWGWLVAGIVLYDLAIKRPIIMGMVRACNLGIGLAIATDRVVGLGKPRIPIEIILVPLFYVTSLTFVSTLEEGVFRRWKVFAGAGGMILAAILSVVWIPYLSIRDRGAELGRALEAAAPAWWPAGILILWIARRAGDAVNRKGILLLVRGGVAGILLIDSALLLSNRQTVTGVIVAAMIVPAALSVALFKRLP
jgi:4-hydroxybenzoate polyprenyltransferase